MIQKIPTSFASQNQVIYSNIAPAQTDSQEDDDKKYFKRLLEGQESSTIEYKQ